MICDPCKKAADEGLQGIEAHAEAGCRNAIDLLALRNGDLSPEEYKTYAGQTFCDCQHRDDLPKPLAEVQMN